MASKLQSKYYPDEVYGVFVELLESLTEFNRVTFFIDSAVLFNAPPEKNY